MSSSSYSSTASLIPKSRSAHPNAQPQKDYSAAFANLQSTYGANGHAPSPAPKAAARPVASQPSATPSLPQNATTYPAQTKNFEAAFGALSSGYGFGGALPKPASKEGGSRGSK